MQLFPACGHGVDLWRLRLLPAYAVGCAVLILAIGMVDTASTKDDPPRNAKDAMHGWTIVVTIRSGTGMEILRDGWYSILMRPNGTAKVVVYRTLKSENAEGKSIFDGQLNDEQHKSVIEAAAAAIQSSLLTVVSEKAEDGVNLTVSAWRGTTTLKLNAPNRVRLADAGSEFPKFIEVINNILDPKTPTIVVR